MQLRSIFLSRVALFSVVLALALSCQPKSAMAQDGGFVYIATNQTTGNAVIQFARGGDGSLTKVSQVSTGGLGGAGNGVGALDPLGSEDSLVLNGDGSLLLVVNAGSNQISSLRAGEAGLQLLSTRSSGGSFPNSVALHGNLVYVLNAHGTPNISGFRLSSAGLLQPIAGSTRNLPGSTAAPHDIIFSPDGTRLLVSEDVTNQIDVFQLDNSGLPAGVTSTASAGAGPFGMRFGREGTLVNTEAGSGSVSSYTVTPQNTLNVVSPAVPTTQQASCWISLTRDGKFGFVSNTGSGTLSVYHIAGNSTLQRQRAVAASVAGAAPIDSALTGDGEFLYVVDSAMGRIVFFRINGASLRQIGTVTGLPTSIQGVAAQ
ncbi:MAG TPA: beta-propeller fold lactonase family protein [Candidatus Angelobacter sp.]|nr:beta-propeller fold lactonase family protein [Candidatus Angelobacter sp.]